MEISDTCEHVFIPKSIYIQGDVEVIVLECPYCGSMVARRNGKEPHELTPQSAHTDAVSQ